MDPSRAAGSSSVLRKPIQGRSDKSGHLRGTYLSEGITQEDRLSGLLGTKLCGPHWGYVAIAHMPESELLWSSTFLINEFGNHFVEPKIAPPWLNVYEHSIEDVQLSQFKDVHAFQGFDLDYTSAPSEWGMCDRMAGYNYLPDSTEDFWASLCGATSYPESMVQIEFPDRQVLQFSAQHGRSLKAGDVICLENRKLPAPFLARAASGDIGAGVSLIEVYAEVTPASLPHVLRYGLPTVYHRASPAVAKYFGAVTKACLMESSWNTGGPYAGCVIVESEPARLQSQQRLVEHPGAGGDIPSGTKKYYWTGADNSSGDGNNPHVIHIVGYALDNSPLACWPRTME